MGVISQIQLNFNSILRLENHILLHDDYFIGLLSCIKYFYMELLREGADAVDFRTQTKIKICSFNFKDPSF